MAIRTVKDIISKVLREVKQETGFDSAQDCDYDLVFNAFTDMIDEYDSKGYALWGNKPESMHDSIGTQDPIKFIVSNLVMDVCDHFKYQPTRTQMARASSSRMHVINRTLEPQYFSGQGNPRGSGNSHLFGYFTTSDSNGLEDETGASLIAG